MQVFEREPVQKDEILDAVSIYSIFRNSENKMSDFLNSKNYRHGYCADNGFCYTDKDYWNHSVGNFNNHCDDLMTI